MPNAEQRMVQEHSHPSAQRLAAFGSGRLSGIESAEIESHVAACDTCCQTLLSAPGDALVQKLRAVMALPDMSATPFSDLAKALAEHPRYQVLELLGAGGMGSVYKAMHRLMNRIVALKVIHRFLMGRPAAVERFRREVRAAARLTHPNIVTAYDAEQAGDSHFLVMEFVEGVSLDRLVAERGQLSAAEACDYARQAALGLQHAFEHGMVHRDIKPQNLMRTPEGQVKILDFGLAQFADLGPAGPVAAETLLDFAPGALTQTGAILGTPDYIAPEQTADSRQADVRTDLYSLGATLYFLLTGQPPFPGGTIEEKLAAHRQQPPTLVTVLRPEVPAGLARVVERMLAKEPAHRYQTPAAVTAALGPFTGSHQSSRRRFVKAFMALTGGGLLLALGGGWLGRTGHGLAPTARPIQEVRCFVGHPVGIETVAISPDGRRVAAGGPGCVLVWDAETGAELRSLPMPDRPVHTVSFSPNGRGLLAGAADGVLRLWNLDNGELSRDFPTVKGSVWSAAFAPDGLAIYAGGFDAILRLWDVSTGEERRRYVGLNFPIFSVAVAPNGSRVAFGSWNGDLRIWEADTGRQLRNVAGHHAPVRRLSFSPDGRQMLSGGYDLVIRLWDVESGEELRRFEGHRNWIQGLAFSPDGRRAVSGSWDETIRLWDVATGAELAQNDRPHTQISEVRFASDGRHVLSCGKDGKARLWLLPE